MQFVYTESSSKLLIRTSLPLSFSPSATPNDNVTSEEKCQFTLPTAKKNRNKKMMPQFRYEH